MTWDECCFSRQLASSTSVECCKNFKVRQTACGALGRPHHNKVFAGNNINIASQYLQTNEAIDDVVIDIDVAHSDIALAKLAEVPGTLRSRVIF